MAAPAKNKIKPRRLRRSEAKNRRKVRSGGAFFAVCINKKQFASSLLINKGMKRRLRRKVANDRPASQESKICSFPSDKNVSHRFDNVFVTFLERRFVRQQPAFFYFIAVSESFMPAAACSD
jgi:hypothetical protein